MVDSGNARQAALAIDSLPPPYPDVPDPAPPSLGYFNGRLSNGYNFADLLSLSYTGVEPSTTFPYGFPGLTDPGSTPLSVGTSLNFAYGGAQAIQGFELVPSLTSQIDAYAALAGRADPNALYLITIGGNDLLQMVPASGPIASEMLGGTHLGDVAGRIVGEASRLFDLGAKNILLTGAPDLGLAPEYLGTQDEAIRRAAGTHFSTTLDSFLQGGINQLSLTSDERLIFFSFKEFTSAVFADPSAYGFTNVTDACLNVRIPSPNIDCDGFAFFDAVHPTAQAHQLIASSIVSRLAAPAVPEPSTWAMMLLGFGMIGAAMRSAKRRQRIAAPESVQLRDSALCKLMSLAAPAAAVLN